MNKTDENFQRKAEKIAQAIYLVSYHIKDIEPLKWELRKESIAFLVCSRSIDPSANFADDVKDLPTDIAIEALRSCSEDIIAFLQLSSSISLISKSNTDIIIREIESILTHIEQDGKDMASKAGFVLSEEFFKQLEITGKGQIGIQQKGRSAVIEKQKTSENIKDKKESRQERILSLLKNRPNLTIKDFANVISDCSEKTIQRELIDLVEKGIIKREGERRWSKYSLK